MTQAASGTEEFTGRLAVVTGGASGIGRATAALFAARGATVVIADLYVSRGRDAAASIAAITGARVIAIELDLRDNGSIIAAIKGTVEAFGPIDILANVAGIYPRARLTDTTDGMMGEIFEVNFFGPFKAIRAVIPHMLRNGGGCIVNVASGTAFRPVLKLGAYAASKSALVALSRSLALELAPDIRVNVVAPGPTDVESTMAGRDPSVGAGASSPMLRNARPEEVAEAILFMASDRAKFVTGQTLHVNGGRLMS